MTAEIDRTTLFSKLAEVTGAIRNIPKNGKNQHFGYSFVTDGDVSAALSEQLSSRKVQVFVSGGDPVVEKIQKDNGKSTLITHVMMTVTFACGDTGATFSVTMPGTGEDPADKGTYKAITGGVKYALLKTFLIATGDDPENALPLPPPANAAALDAAFAGTAAPAPAPPAATVAPLTPAQILTLRNKLVDGGKTPAEAKKLAEDCPPAKYGEWIAAAEKLVAELAAPTPA